MSGNKEQQIIEAAIRVFARKGLEKGRIADIAVDAGIGKGTVYEYFRSKEEIFTAIESSVMQEMMNQLAGLVGSDLSPRNKLEALLEQGMDAMIGMGDAILIMTELWAQAARGLWHDSGDTFLEEVYEEFRVIVKEILRAGVEAGQFREMSYEGVATLLLAFMDGLAWQYMLIRDHEKFENVKKEAIRSFMRGINK
ncbi:MAG: TetR/AcrR family transcriptional regulator [Candidatus Marinimicrobia bacterium]|nr:TetR/AcrR family transcriptional regulator [Candidatus Neomarinimicrobiota bacterium]